MLSSLFSNFINVSSSSGQISNALSTYISMLESSNSSPNQFALFLRSLTTDHSLLLTGITFILAIIGCLFGYKLARLFMAITGFIFGIFAGVFIATRFLNVSQNIVLLCGIGGGIILSILAYRIILAGIFLMCFFMAFITAADLLPFNGNLQFFVAIIVGIIVGSLAIRYVRQTIIVTSSLVCSHSAVKAFMVLAPLTNLEILTRYSSAEYFIGLFMVGLLFQFITTRNDD